MGKQAISSVTRVVDEHPECHVAYKKIMGRYRPLFKVPGRELQEILDHSTGVPFAFDTPTEAVIAAGNFISRWYMGDITSSRYFDGLVDPEADPKTVFRNFNPSQGSLTQGRQCQTDIKI